MSTPPASNGSGTTGAGFDFSKLPPELQAYIQQQIAAAFAATQPAPPKELTPAEKAALYLQQAESGMRGEKAISPGSLYVHDRILAMLDILIDTVFPQDAPAPDAPPVPGGPTESAV